MLTKIHLTAMALFSVLMSCSSSPEDDPAGGENSSTEIRVAFTLSGSNAATAAAQVDENMPHAIANFSFFAIYGEEDSDQSILRHYFDVFLDKDHTIDKYQDQYFKTGYDYPGPRYVVAYAFGLTDFDKYTYEYSRPYSEYYLSHNDSTTGHTVYFSRVDNKAFKNQDWENIYSTIQNGANANKPFDLGQRGGTYSGRIVFRHVATKFNIYMWRSEDIAGDALDQQIHDIRVYAPLNTVPTRLSWNVQVGYFADAWTTGTEIDRHTDIRYFDGDAYREVYSVPSGEYDQYLPSGRDNMIKVTSIYLDVNERTYNATLNESFHPASHVEPLTLKIVAKYGNTDKELNTITVNATPSIAATQSTYFLYQPGQEYDIKLGLTSDSFKVEANMLDWVDGRNGFLTVVRPGGK